MQEYETLKHEIVMLQQKGSGLFIAVNPSLNIQSPVIQKWTAG
jgi:hypothetical protein